MKDSKYCKMMACCWAHRYGLLGLVLLIIATTLTLISFNSLGIVAMFLVGLVLCCHRYLSCPMCHSHHHCHSSDEDMGGCCPSMDDKKKTSTSKTKD